MVTPRFVMDSAGRELKVAGGTGGSTGQETRVSHEGLHMRIVITRTG